MNKTVKFNEQVEVCETYHNEDYDRTSIEILPVRYLPVHELKELRYEKIHTSIKLGMYDGLISDIECYYTFIDTYRKSRISVS